MEFLQQGITQARKGNYATAIDSFDKAIASNSQSAEAYYHRGLAYYNSGNIERAIADYDLSLNLVSQVDVYLSRAKAFLDLDNIQSSIIDLQAVFSLDPNCDRAYKLRANICIGLKEYDRAIAYLKQAGKIYLERQDKESCRFCIARIRQIEQQKIAEQGGVTNQVFFQQIEREIQQGNLKQALHDCSWLLQLDPYSGEAYRYRGNINLKLGEGDLARRDLLQAAKCFRTQGNVAESERLERRCWELRLNNLEEQISTPNLPSLIRTSHPQNSLQDRLNLLVGDWNTAQSMVERLMQQHPGKSESWYWKRAIADTEDDLREL